MKKLIIRRDLLYCVVAVYFVFSMELAISYRCFLFYTPQGGNFQHCLLARLRFFNFITVFIGIPHLGVGLCLLLILFNSILKASQGVNATNLSVIQCILRKTDHTIFTANLFFTLGILQIE